MLKTVPVCLFFFLSNMFLFACASNTAKSAAFAGYKEPTLIVFAASSLTEAFEEIASQFEMEHPGVSVTLNLASSTQLAQQISLGAPADVFSSADQAQMQVAVDAGQIEASRMSPFAGNRLVVIYPQDNPAGITRLQDIARQGMRLALADRLVPVGNYSRQFLEKASLDPNFGVQFKDGVLANVVTYEPNTRLVLSKVLLGEMDAGIVYFTDAISAGDPGVRWLEIPPSLNIIARYYIAIVRESPQPDLAAAFVDLVLSPSGQQILTAHGMLPVK